MSELEKLDAARDFIDRKFQGMLDREYLRMKHTGSALRSIHMKAYRLALVHLAHLIEVEIIAAKKPSADPDQLEFELNGISK